MDFDRETKAEIVKLVQVVAKMPPPPPLPEAIPLPLDRIRCACGGDVDISVAKVYHTGVIKACEVVCPGCVKQFKGLSRIVCCSCKQIVGWLKPHKDQSGFEYKPDVTYHEEICGFCHMGAESATIIEKFLYNRQKQGDKKQIINLKPTKK